MFCFVVKFAMIPNSLLGVIIFDFCYMRSLIRHRLFREIIFEPSYARAMIRASYDTKPPPRWGNFRVMIHARFDLPEL